MLGADGLEQFNFFVTDQVRVPGQRAAYAALRRLDDLEFLRGKEKHYAFNTASGRPEEIWDLPEQLPVRLAPGHRRGFRLPMCDEPSGAGLRLVVQAVAERAGGAEGLGVEFNGARPSSEGRETDELLFPAGPYSRHVAEHVAFDYPFGVDAIREGWNEIALSNESSGAVNLVGLEIAVKKAGGPP